MEISELLSQPHDMNPGSAAPYLASFAAQMGSVGHTSLTIGFYLGSAVHFGGWLEASGLDFADINEDTIKAFGAHRCECPGRRSHKYLSRAYTARVQRFVDFLRQHGALRAIADSTAQTPSPLNSFRDWLLQHRGLSMVTVERHERLLTRMLPALGADAGKYKCSLGANGYLGSDSRLSARSCKNDRRSAPCLFAIPCNEWRMSTGSRPCTANGGRMETFLTAPVPRRPTSGSPH